MTYLQFHLVFILPPLLLLGWAYARRSGRPPLRQTWPWVLLVSAIALVFTTPWDNYLVWREVWTYGPDRVIGTIGYVPVEEYLFFVLQPLLTGAFLLWIWKPDRPPAVAAPRSRWIGTAVLLVLALAGIAALTTTRGLYMGLILAWSAPVLAGQWAYAGHWFWRRRRLWALSTAIPTAYLWAADRVALHLGIWAISERYTTGLHLLGLPVEEALFFLVTNLLVVQGVMLFLRIGDD